jgi:hypothetical protein
VTGPGGTRDANAWRPVLTGLSEIELQFFDGLRWQSNWDSKETGRLPQAVRIAMAVADRKGLAHHYATTVLPACRSGPDTNQTPSERL